MTMTTPPSDNNAYLESLKTRHMMIARELSHAQHSVSTADYYLTQLKKQKLILKDAIQSLIGKAANQSVQVEERA